MSDEERARALLESVVPLWPGPTNERDALVATFAVFFAEVRREEKLATLEAAAAVCDDLYEKASENGAQGVADTAGWLANAIRALADNGKKGSP